MAKQVKTMALPSAWRAGDKAKYTESDEDFTRLGYPGHVVTGKLRGRVTLDDFRIFRGRRAWYVSGTLPTSTGGALAYEDDLRELDGSVRVDKPFQAFMGRLLDAGEVINGDEA